MAVSYKLAALDAQIQGISYRLYGLDARAGAKRYQLADLDATVGAPFEVTLGANAFFNPFDVAVLTASSLSVPDSWVFEQINALGGVVVTPTVTLSGSGGSRTYKCPGRFSEQVLYFRVTATLGTQTSVAEVVHTVGPHSGTFGPNGVGWEYHP